MRSADNLSTKKPAQRDIDLARQRYQGLVVQR